MHGPINHFGSLEVFKFWVVCFVARKLNLNQSSEKNVRKVEMKVERSEGFKLNVVEMFVVSGFKKLL